MSRFERFLVPGFAEFPKCLCGGTLRNESTDQLPERNDTHIRVYDCSACQHEMWITVWGSDVLN
jgi:hypothetical protein